MNSFSILLLLGLVLCLTQDLNEAKTLGSTKPMKSKKTSMDTTNEELEQSLIMSGDIINEEKENSMENDENDLKPSSEQGCIRRCTRRGIPYYRCRRCCRAGIPPNACGGGGGGGNCMRRCTRRGIPYYRCRRCCRAGIPPNACGGGGGGGNCMRRCTRRGIPYYRCRRCCRAGIPPNACGPR